MTDNNECISDIETSDYHAIHWCELNLKTWKDTLWTRKVKLEGPGINLSEGPSIIFKIPELFAGLILIRQNLQYCNRVPFIWQHSILFRSPLHRKVI